HPEPGRAALPRRPRPALLPDRDPGAGPAAGRAVRGRHRAARQPADHHPVRRRGGLRGRPDLLLGRRHGRAELAGRPARHERAARAAAGHLARCGARLEHDARRSALPRDRGEADMRRIPVAPLVKFVVFAVVVAMCTTVLALTIANAAGGDRLTYTARFTDASGLLPGDDVRIAGVVVGSVEDVRIADRRFAEVEFSVAADQPLPASVQASILYRNLIGQRYLALEQGAGPTGETLPPGGTIPVERTRPPLNLTVLFNGFKPLLTA